MPTDFINIFCITRKSHSYTIITKQSHSYEHKKNSQLEIVFNIIGGKFIFNCRNFAICVDSPSRNVKGDPDALAHCDIGFSDPRNCANCNFTIFWIDPIKQAGIKNSNS